VTDEMRRSLAANGLQVGIVTGDPPPEVREVLNAPPPRKVDPATIILPDGDSTLVNVEASKAQLDLLLAQSGKSFVGGKRFSDAHGFLRISARQQPEDTIELRLMPELHHGDVRQGWGVAPGGGSFAPQQFVMQSGQAEESFRDLAAIVSVRPGQLVVLGCQPDRRGSLGHFLFSANEPNSDRVLNKVLFLWAERYNPADPPAITTPPGLQPIDPPAMPEPVDTAARPSRRDARRAARSELAMSR
jgi:hypothetical protein